jgi:hypothetical protein
MDFHRVLNGVRRSRCVPRWPACWVLILIGLLPGALYGVTTSGTLTSNETWGGDVLLTGDVTVPNWVQLTIEPGATVIFPANSDDQSGGADSARTELIVNGSLLAEGSLAQPITFRSDAATPAQGDWGGVRIIWANDAVSLNMDHCLIEHATGGLVLGATAGTHAGTVSNTEVRNSSGHGIYVYTRSSAVLNVTFESCSSVSNSASGFCLDARTASTLGGTIDGFDASGNVSHGIYSYSADSSSFTDVTVADGTVVSNGSHGVYIHDYNSSRQTFDIERVAIAGNSGHGVYCYGQNNYGATMTVSLTDATVTNNTSDGFSHYTYQGASDITLTRTLLAENGSRGVYMRSIYGNYTCRAKVRGCVIRDNPQQGAHLFADSSSTMYCNVEANEINGNGSHGLYLQRSGTSYPVFSLNHIHDNGGYGIICQANTSPVMVANRIAGNASRGIDLNATAAGTISRNSFVDNRGDYEFVVNGAGAVDAPFNYWGTNATPQMAATPGYTNVTDIYDAFNDDAKGLVDYRPWLDTEPAVPSNVVSFINAPTNGASEYSAMIRIEGVAASSNGVDFVEVSTDGGTNWSATTGSDVWTYDWPLPVDGTYTLLSRVTDLQGLVETPSSGVQVAIDSGLPTTRGTLPGSQVWSGEILIRGDVTVPPGATHPTPHPAHRGTSQTVCKTVCTAADRGTS